MKVESEVLISPYNLSSNSHTVLCSFSAPRYLIKVYSQSLIFKNLEIIRFCAKSYPVFEISKIEIKSEECAQEISSCFICFTQHCL